MTRIIVVAMAVISVMFMAATIWPDAPIWAKVMLAISPFFAIIACAFVVSGDCAEDERNNRP